MDKEMHLQENTLFDLDPKVKVTWNAAQYPLHHVAYAAAKFDVAIRRCIYKKIHYLEMLASTLYIMWPMHLWSLKLLCRKV